MAQAGVAGRPLDGRPARRRSIYRYDDVRVGLGHVTLLGHMRWFYDVVSSRTPSVVRR
jgi:hypothetical protein